MKKFFTLCIALFGFGLVNAQNIVQNQSLETWADGKALPWDFFAGATTTAVYSQETVIVKDGTSAVKITNPSTGGTAANVSQAIPATFVPGDTYVLSFDYYVVSGDETDVRIWSGWKSGTTDIAHNYDVLRIGSVDSKDYLPSNTGAWSSYTCETTVPANATVFDFKVRNYKGSVVVFDNFSLKNKDNLGVGDNLVDLSFNASSKHGLISVKGISSDAKFIEVYNVLGKQIAKVKANSDNNEIPVQAGQLVIVKVGNEAVKLITK